MQFKQFLPAIVVMVISCGCSHVGQSSHIDYKDRATWVIVAYCDGTDPKRYGMVEQVLKEKGIDCYMGGSILYDVYVSTNHLTEAKKVLQEDPRLKHEWIRFP
jgi:hypothetical protein